MDEVDFIAHLGFTFVMIKTTTTYKACRPPGEL